MNTGLQSSPLHTHTKKRSKEVFYLKKKQQTSKHVTFKLNKKVTEILAKGQSKLYWFDGILYNVFLF